MKKHQAHLLQLLCDSWKDGQYAPSDEVQILPSVTATQAAVQQLNHSYQILGSSSCIQQVT